VTQPTEAGTGANGVFERYLAALNSRDLDPLTALAHPEYEDFYPQSGEVTTFEPPAWRAQWVEVCKRPGE
jgi:hypothetical protein